MSAQHRLRMMAALAGNGLVREEEEAAEEKEEEEEFQIMLV